MSTRRRIAALAAVAILGLGGAACSDEDGDGATTDEEQRELEETGEDIGDRIDQELEEGENERDGDGEE
jgi:hypothetical protein